MTKSSENVEKIEVSLAQGRFYQSFMPRVAGYQINSLNAYRSLQVEGDERSFSPRESGLTMHIESDGDLNKQDKEKIFGQIGTLMSLAIFEQRDDSFKVKSDYVNQLL